MDTKICKKCNRKFELDKFTHSYKNRRKLTKYVTNTCHDCHYGWNDFWKNATEQEKFQRMKELFERRVIRQDGCWEFKGTISSTGYFEIKIGGRYKPKSMKAHRISWIIHKGEIPKGMHVLHRCDNPRCTCPSHLFLGTNHDNVLDKESKGRGNQPKEEDHNKAVLTRKQVKKIKQLLKLGVMATKIARDFGVGSSTIYNIKYGNTWRHVK